jgi:hypothetical protein
MSLATPLGLTITGFNGGSAISLPRTQDERFQSVYEASSSDGLTLYRLTVSQKPIGQIGTPGYSVQAMIRLDITVIAADPFQADRNISQTASTWLVTKKPAFGFTPTNIKDMVAGLFGALSASSYAITVQVIGGEH